MKKETESPFAIPAPLVATLLMSTQCKCLVLMETRQVTTG